MSDKAQAVSAVGEALADIPNVRVISVAGIGPVGTSGQPTAEQFQAIRNSGYQRVINLLPETNDSALADEAELVKHLGMEYIYIPVDFTAPTESDYQSFCAALNDSRCKQTWVHCAANYRVSAFFYRYRKEHTEFIEDIVRTDVDAIWSPNDTWKTFVQW